MKILAVIAAAAVASIGSLIPTARAADSEDPPTVTVRFADLDLTRDAGSGTLYGRLSLAARHVCQELDPGLSAGLAAHTLQQHHAACIDRAIRDAVAKIGRPTFTAYVARTGAHPKNIKLAAQ